MTSDDSGPSSDRPQLSPRAITARLHEVEAGDELVVNDRERILEVVETDRYSIVADDRHGNRYTISQNLQTGGWSIHEDVWWVDTADRD